MNVNLASSLFFQKRIQVFCVLCQTRSFTDTGKVMNMSQPAVSKNILSLEDDLGITLVEREKRPLSLTIEGKLLFDLLMQQNQALNAWIRDLQLQVNKHIPLRFGAISSIAKYVNVKIAQGLSSVSNTMSLEGYSKDLVRAFEIGDIDFFISSEPYWDQNCYRRFVFREPSVLLVPLSFQKPEKISWESMRFCGLPRVANSIASTNGQFEQSYFASLDIQFVNRITVDGSQTFLEYIKSGLGWGLQTPLFVAMYPEFFKSIQILPMPEPVVCPDLYLLSRTEPSFMSQADKITDIIRKTLIDDVIPELLHVMPWIAPYLKIPGQQGLEKRAINGIDS